MVARCGKVTSKYVFVQRIVTENRAMFQQCSCRSHAIAWPVAWTMQLPGSHGSHIRGLNQRIGATGQTQRRPRFEIRCRILRRCRGGLQDEVLGTKEQTKIVAILAMVFVREGSPKFEILARQDRRAAAGGRE